MGIATQGIGTAVGLTDLVTGLHLQPCVGRPSIRAALRRDRMLPLRFTEIESPGLEPGVEALGMSVTQLFREGAVLYIKMKSKDGHRTGKEKKER
jgi:hypothetical protein